jgi:putative ABC transport system ATP-binding protein
MSFCKADDQHATEGADLTVIQAQRSKLPGSSRATTRRNQADPRSELAQIFLLDKTIMHLEATCAGWTDRSAAGRDPTPTLPEPQQKPRGRPKKTPHKWSLYVSISTTNLTKIYGSGDTAVTALNKVSIDVAPGEFVAVMGPSGCGKSTLLHLLGGLDRPTQGSVIIDGHNLSELPDSKLTELRRRKIGFIFQFFNLIPVLNAVENTALPITLDGVKPEQAKTRATEWLEKVGLGDRMTHRPDQLSGGQQQRVAIARALVADPALVLADEPTGNLDTRSSDEIAVLLRQVANEWGRSVIIVTHDPRIAAHADRILFLKDGSIADETILSLESPK